MNNQHIQSHDRHAKNVVIHEKKQVKIPNKTELERTQQRAIDMYAYTVFDTKKFDLVITLNLYFLNLFCPKLQNHPQHILFSSNYLHLIIFYGDKMAPKVDF